MKRIISLTIFAAMQLVCIAQENPKLESLYAYLKAKGLVKYYTFSNKNQVGLRKRYDFNFGLHDDGPAPIKDFMGRLLDAKEDSAVRAEWRSYREAFHVIRRTLSELTEDAAESYSYEYHLNGHDTIITTIALKPYENSPIPKKFEYPENDSYGTGKTPEMVFSVIQTQIVDLNGVWLASALENSGSTQLSIQLSMPSKTLMSMPSTRSYNHCSKTNPLSDMRFIACTTAPSMSIPLTIALLLLKDL